MLVESRDAHQTLESYHHGTILCAGGRLMILKSGMIRYQCELKSIGLSLTDGISGIRVLDGSNVRYLVTR